MRGYVVQMVLILNAAIQAWNVWGFGVGTVVFCSLVAVCTKVEP